MILGQEHDLPLSCCTACGKELDRASGLLADAGVDDNVRPGDVTVCLGCGHLMALDDDLRLRDLTDDEAYKVDRDARLLAIRRARAAIIQGG
jgi:hypothetical protein